MLDQEGVGELVRIACTAARAAKPSIKLGACGEHAGHPDSAAFLVRLGLDSVSCSPFRVPLARLGVAQALLACGRVKISDIEFDLAPARPPRAASRLMSCRRRLRRTIDIDEALVLHTLRVRGFVTPDGFRESLGAHPAEILADARRRRARCATSRSATCTACCRPARSARRRCSTATPVPTSKPDCAPHYERFLELNEVFKQLCTDWQMRGDTQNDHTDAAYDAACVDRLTAAQRRRPPDDRRLRRCRCRGWQRYVAAARRGGRQGRARATRRRSPA